MPNLLPWICGFLLLTANLYGQIDRGSLTGTVRDSSGLAVPGSGVTASQDATGLKRTTISSAPATYADALKRDRPTLLVDVQLPGSLAA